MNNESYNIYGYCKGIDAKTGKIIYGYFAILPYTTYCFTEDYKAHPENNKEYIINTRMVDWGLPNRVEVNPIKSGSMRQFLGYAKNKMPIFQGDRVKWNWSNGRESVTLSTIIFFRDWMPQIHDNKNDYWNTDREIWLSECELMKDGLEEEI